MKKKTDAIAHNVIQIDFKARHAAKYQGASELDRKKYDLFASWIKLGTVCVLFDARASGVRVPEEYKNCGDLRLNFCYSFQVADFNFNDDCVFASLLFDDGEYFCQIPWGSVYGLQSKPLNQGAVWFEHFPSDYDQVSVLGFSEQMCAEWAEATSEGADDLKPHSSNVIELDFSAK